MKCLADSQLCQAKEQQYVRYQIAQQRQQQDQNKKKRKDLLTECLSTVRVVIALIALRSSAETIHTTEQRQQARTISKRIDLLT